MTVQSPVTGLFDPGPAFPGKRERPPTLIVWWPWPRDCEADAPISESGDCLPFSSHRRAKKGPKIAAKAIPGRVQEGDPATHHEVIVVQPQPPQKRHDMLKNTLQVTPAYLHNVSRLEALLFLEYLAVTVHALVKRELRTKMEDNHVNEIPVYPEGRECRAPTAERVFNIFEHVQMHDLVANGRRIQTFQPQLTRLQLELLEMLGVSPANYTVS